MNHAAAAGDPQALAEQKRRAQAGAARTNAPKLVRAGRLRSTGDLLNALEGALRDVVRSASSDLVAKANSTTAIVKAAREILKDAVLERENAELKALIAERMPELRKHLKVAS